MKKREKRGSQIYIGAPGSRLSASLDLNLEG